MFCVEYHKISRTILQTTQNVWLPQHSKANKQNNFDPLERSVQQRGRQKENHTNNTKSNLNNTTYKKSRYQVSKNTQHTHPNGVFKKVTHNDNIGNADPKGINKTGPDFVNLFLA